MDAAPRWHRTDLRGEPWRYPGTACTGHLLLGVPQTGGGPCWAPLSLASGPTPATVGLPDRSRPLGDVLADLGLAPLEARRPVAAHGSNADPAVLHRKLADARVPPVAPLVTARVGNARPAVSAHVSSAGYLPAAATAAHGRRLPVVVAWLDDAQRRALDDTEPNYDPVVLDESRHPVVADGGSPIRDVVVYDTRRGVLPVEPPRGGQLALWRRVLADVPGVAGLLTVDAGADDAALRALLGRLAGDPRLRDAVRSVLARRAAPSGLARDGGSSGSPNLSV
jgi:hypothetical protein